jgi:hypothetical protein
VELLDVRCFSRAEIDSLMFEADSRLARIGEACFARCCMRQICIPRSVEVIEDYAFSWAQIEVFLFESGSRLARLGESCFTFCPLKSICIPAR